ncbi:hypothetical protein HPO96_16725 [Kribbella sandramycini]|uniref:Uncharacterized protein n=1 Tax=Kribbella sandramycini TaxID=60450 RepID=A0A7Y4L1R0_9ACTN|nr:hypothetical protein [Kribbella sandramycini]MBB6565629.1 hypothetical protein [Kribbella sandramycini]NOL41892.1 hypothetical protein [Kribbella sandramycini]
MKTRILAALCAVPLAAGVLGAAPAYAEPDPLLSVTSVQLSKTSVTVTGLQTEKIDVTVKGGYDSDNPGDENTTLNVYLKRTSGSGDLTRVVSTDLKRTAGTVQNGTWTGPLNVPSTADGTFTVFGVGTGPYGSPGSGMPYDITPYAGQNVLVKGSHQPKITWTVSPAVVPVGKPYKITWKVTDSATGKPFGGKVRVGAGVDNVCAEGGPAQTFTDANGVLTKSYAASDAAFLHCFEVPTEPYAIVSESFFVKRQAGVSATPAKTSAKVGTVVPVNGSVSGAPYKCAVHFQRLQGASQWRTVSSSTVRSSGRFTVDGKAVAKGKLSYRVLLSACDNFAAASSKSFAITGV